MKLNINDFLALISIKTKELSNDVTETLFILNNCEVIGKIHQIIENSDLDKLKDNFLEFYLYSFLKVKGEVKRETNDNFEAILLKDVRVRNNFGDVYKLPETLINVDTINTVIFLNNNNKPF